MDLGSGIMKFNLWLKGRILISFKLQAASSKQERSWLPQNPWYKVSMSRSLKPEFQEGGSKRQVILDRSVEYILDPKFGFQGDKHAFLVDKVGLCLRQNIWNALTELPTVD